MFLTIPLQQICAFEHTPLLEVIEIIQSANKQIALVIDQKGHLLGTITDGDVRRAILKNLPLDTLASQIMQHEFTAGKVGMTSVEIYALMCAKLLRHIPLVDDEGMLVDLVWISDLLRQHELDIPAVIMAGGFGKRLRPLTEHVPKPMLPVNGRPLLEHIIQQLQRAGIRKVNLTTHYLEDVILKHFGDGHEFGVDLQYVREEEPLGTAGSLSLLETFHEPLLVMNSDILTKVDFRAMLDFHTEHQADMTVAVRKQEFQIPFGVIEHEGIHITGISEKPVQQCFINAGIYLIDPKICQLIPPNRPYDMPHLIQELIKRELRIISFPVHEYWVDIGRLSDYEKAVMDAYHEGEEDA